MGPLNLLNCFGGAEMLAEAPPATSHSTPQGISYAVLFLVVCSTLATAIGLFLIRRWIFGYNVARRAKPPVDAWALASERIEVEDPDDQQYPPADPDEQPPEK